MRINLFILLLICVVLSNDKQLYSTIQMMDQVMIIDPETLQINQSVSTEFGDGMQMQDCMDYSTEMNCNMSSGCQWMMGMCMQSADSDVMNTPHFIALDEINGYWFVSTIASGFIAQYSLVNNVLIDTYFVGDAPALLALDPINQKVYCSRMMPMNGMGNMMPTAESNVIQGLNYNSMGLFLSENQEYIIDSPAPHGLAINHNGTELYTASNTADWLYKIDTMTHEITGVVMDEMVDNTPDQVTQRLKPIQCISVGNKLFVSCSSGTWMNPHSGEQTIIQGSVQLWNSDTMLLLDTLELGEHTAPWHMKESPVDNLLYVALAGDNLYDTEGLACVRYDNDLLTLEWVTNDSSFDTFHGVDVSSDGSYIYVSARGDGYIHVFNSDGILINSVLLGTMSMLGGLAIEQIGLPVLGDLNNDSISDVSDIVMIINVIFNPMMSSPYSNYSSDINSDNITNIFDIILLIENILSR